MDAINRMVRAVRNSDIPEDMLMLAFKSKVVGISNETLDRLIELRVIKEWLLPDLNVYGGTEHYIPMDKLTIVSSEPEGVRIYIPPEATQGRGIISVISLVGGETFNTEYVDGSPIGMLAMTNTAFDTAGVSYTMIERISDREVFIFTDDLTDLGDMVLRVNLEYSNRLNQIRPRTYPHIEKLAVLATKAYIWKTLVMKKDKASLYHGHELSIVSSLIDRYENAYDLYHEELNTMTKKKLFMNDAMKMKRYLNLITPLNQ